MALRARLSPPREEQAAWPWHNARWGALPVSEMLAGERRLEADNYLSSGYALRVALVAKKSSIVPLAELARVWQPSRLKGIQVSRQFGTPFLAATQVYDLRPSPRKFLALERTENFKERFVSNGTIVVTCSGSVGRATLTYAPHENTLISHDLLRVSPLSEDYWGWIYAYLRSDQAREMMGSAQYGHIIKHLEPAHLNALPVPIVDKEVRDSFQRDVAELLKKRNKAWALQKRAEQQFALAVGFNAHGPGPETGFDIQASDIFSRRRRIDASFHSPVATRILQWFDECGLPTEPLADVTDGVWWLSRFKRVFGDDGVRYLSADELFSVNPPTTKRVLIEQAENVEKYFVKKDWIIMACSGQTYGLNGSVALMTNHHEHAFFSHDLVRIVPKSQSIRAGYLFTALGHPSLGRPLVIRNAYGTSIPHLEPADIMTTPIVRLGAATEGSIADAMEEAIFLRAEADSLENEIAERATQVVDESVGLNYRELL